MKVDYSEQLEEFTEKLKKIPEILAVFYNGSTATKKWDEFSDIDVCILVNDNNYEKIVKKLPELLSMWGKINLCNHYQNYDETYAFIGKDYTKIEIEPFKESDLNKGNMHLKNIRIAFDKNGNLTHAFDKFKDKKQDLEHKEMVWFFLDTRSNFIYSARHYARGQKLSGASEIGNIGGQLFYYLGKIKGMEGHINIRTAEKHLTKKEWNFLKISSCKSLKKSEVKRAIKANWEYMKYLEKMYEQKTKRKLNLQCNDKEILTIINKTLNKSK